MLLHRAIEQIPFPTQRRNTRVWQDLRDALDHRAQTARDLDIAGPAIADLAEDQLNEVVPVRCPKEQPVLPGVITYPVVVQFTHANGSQ